MRKKEFILAFILIGLTGFCAFSQNVAWVSLQEAQQRAGAEQKKVMIDIYTNYCAWCKVMDQRTFSDPEVVQYLNDYFLAVRFNAEEEQALVFKGKSYNRVRNGRKIYHELALEFMRGRLSYPTIVFLDEQLNLIQPIPGYQDASQYIKVLRYFGENYHLRMPWDKYEQQLNQNKAVPVHQNRRHE